MVEKMKVMIAQLRGVFAGMSPSQRVTLGAGALLIFIAVSSIVAFAMRTDFEMLANTEHLDPDERRSLEQMLSDEGIDWDIEGQSIMVEKGARSKIFMRMNLEDKMPNSRQAFEWLYAETPLTAGTPDNFNEKIRLSQGMELEAVINSLNWVHSSKVIITRGNDLDPLKQRRFPTRSTVNIKTRGRQQVDNEDITAVRSLVVYAIPKIKHENVGIVIDGKPYIFKQENEIVKQADEWTQRKVQIENLYEGKLKSYFLGANGEDALYSRMRVAVNIILNREVIKNHVLKRREDSNPVRDMRHTRRTEGKGPGTDEIGVFNETSTTESSLNAEGVTDFVETEEQTNLEFLPGTEEEIIKGEIPGAIKEITVALDFDMNEMLRPTQFDLKNETPLEEILQREIDANRERAARVIGFSDAGSPSILVSAAQFAVDLPPSPPQVVEVLLGVLEKSGGQFLVFGLSLFGFLYFVNVLRQAFETPELEEEMDEEEIARRTSEEDVARMLDAQEANVSDIRARQIEDRVRKMVADNPDEAANLIKRWLLEDEQNG